MARKLYKNPDALAENLIIIGIISFPISVPLAIWKLVELISILF